jgi:hypothetical protein
VELSFTVVLAFNFFTGISCNFVARQYTGPTRKSYWDDHRHAGGMPAIPSINGPAFRPSSYLERVVRQFTQVWNGRRGLAVQTSALTHATDRLSGDDSDFVGLCVRQTGVLLVGKTISVRVRPTLLCRHGYFHFIACFMRNMSSI